MRACRIKEDSLLKRLIEHAFVNENGGNFKRRLPRYLCLNRLCKHVDEGWGRESCYITAQRIAPSPNAKLAYPNNKHSNLII